MKIIDLKPLELLIKKHNLHKGKYSTVFKGIEIIVFPGVLNPSYTKVSGFLSDNIEIPEGAKVLDVFCGSGALGLTHAKSARNILGLDISKKAISCAKENAKKLGFSGKTEYRVSDVFNNIKSKEKFDIIIANPPLLPINPRTEFEKNFADSDEMEINKKFVAGCKDYLEDCGVVYVTTSTASNILLDDGTTEDIVINVAKKYGLKFEIIAELDAGYEIYRVIKLRK